MADEALRIARAEQAKVALSEFLAPAFSLVRTDYMEKLADIAAKPLTDGNRAGMEKLALAIKVVDQVRLQVEQVVNDGTVAGADKQRADKIADMPFEKRRWADMLGVGGR